MNRLGPLLAAVLGLLTTPRAKADTGRQGTDEAVTMPPWVELRVLGDESALSRVRVTAAELFARLDVRLSVVSDADGSASVSGERPLVLAYIDLRVPTAPLVDVDDGHTRQELMRRNLADLSSLETGVEAAVHVVYTTVESLLQLTAAERAAKRSVKPPARASAPPPRGAGLDLGALFRLVSLGDSRVVPGAGAAVELHADVGRLQADLALTGALHTSSQLTFNDGNATLRPYALRLVPGMSAPLSRRLQGAVGIGVGVDHFVLDARTAPSAGTAHDRAVLDPVFASQLGLRFSLGRAWLMSVFGTLDVDLRPARFVVDHGGRHETLFALPRLRGGLLLVASFSATAVQRFRAAGEQP